MHYLFQHRATAKIRKNFINVYFRRIHTKNITANQLPTHLKSECMRLVLFNELLETRALIIQWIVFTEHSQPTSSKVEQWRTQNANHQLQMTTTTAMNEKLLEWNEFAFIALFRNIVKLDGFVSRLSDERKRNATNTKLPRLITIAHDQIYSHLQIVRLVVTEKHTITYYS